jgi:N-acetylglucosamine-6-phosphate deacetylase
MNNQLVKIYNGKIITPYKIISNGSILISGNKILEVSEGNIEAPHAQQIDADEKYIAPGFIDIHVHGGGGYDFMDATEAAFLKAAELHVQYGTTSITPTTLSSSKEELLQVLSLYESANYKNTKGAQFAGLHLEGPYIAMNQRGAQDARFIRNPEPEEYKDILSQTSSVTRWSAAPELKGAIEFGKYLHSKGVLPAIAHTDAIYEEVLAAVRAGYKHVTHLYSAMSGVTRRNAMRFAGVIESAFLLDELTVEIIADGVHLPPPLLKLVYKIKGADKTALITDAMRAAGMPEGESILGSIQNGLKVIIEDNVAKLPDRSSFAGSVATADRLVRNMVNLAEVPLCNAVKMITATPAAIIGIYDKKGSLVTGKDADLVIFDENIKIHATMVMGEWVYKKEGFNENIKL